MATFKRTAQAEEDLIGIWLYIAQDNPDAADRMLDEFENKFSLLADQPQLGPVRPDIAPGLRYFPVRRYLILYRLDAETVEIIRVLHSAQRWTDLL